MKNYLLGLWRKIQMRCLASPQLLTLTTGAFCSWCPTNDELSGLMWVWMDGWREVCDFCHGNCGQCGITGRVGNVGFSLDAIIKNGGWDKGAHVGFVNDPGTRARLARQL